MAIIGFYFRKLTAEKKKSLSGEVKISNNVGITDVKEIKVNASGSKQSGAEFHFNYKTRYEPDVASIDLEGVIVFMGPSEKVKDLVSKWASEKKIAKDITEEIYNGILTKCNIEILMLARDMSLPPHINLPRVEVKS